MVTNNSNKAIECADSVQFDQAGLEISQNRHSPCITKFFGIYGKIITLHWKSSKVLLALQPEALVNTSGRVDFSSPEIQCMKMF